MTCPECGSPLLRNERLVIGHVVLKCKACDTYRLEGDESVMIGPCGDPLTALRRRASVLDAIRREDEMRTSPIDDPRWERID